MDNGFGGGFRVGTFIFPRLSAEFDFGQKQADRPDGLRSVNVETFTARLTGVPLILGPVSVLVGAGTSHTDVQNDIDESEGFQGLVGWKVGLGSSVALRVEGVTEFNDDDIRNHALQLGLSLYRHPRKRVRATPPRAAPQRSDSVSAAEIRRLRADAARDYLVSQGIARSRIDIATRGAGEQLVVEGPDDVVEAANRRAEFKILMAEPGAPPD